MITQVAGIPAGYRIVGYDKAGNEIPIPDNSVRRFGANTTSGDLGKLTADPNDPNTVVDLGTAIGSTGKLAASVTFPSGRSLTAQTDDILIIAEEPDHIAFLPIDTIPAAPTQDEPAPAADVQPEDSTATDTPVDDPAPAADQNPQA